MNDNDNSDWMGTFGECKLCGGEIPHGHSNNCYIYRMQQLTSLFEKYLNSGSITPQEAAQARKLLKEVK